MIRTRTLVLSTTLLIAADCKRPTPPEVEMGQTVRAATVPWTVPATEAEESGLVLRLEDGDAPSGDAARPRVAPATPLPLDRVDALLARLEPLDVAPTAEVALRPASTPPPAPGTTVDLPFPPPPDTTPPDVPPGPVQVLRAHPEGEVPIARGVSVTFDRPMVALTTQDRAAGVVPVQLTPQPEGQWRWVGTRTLLFEPSLRMPMATAYRLEVPAGTRAADGSTLETAWTSEFATPPVRLAGSTPTSGPTGLLPVVAMTFDQAVDADALVGALRVEASPADRAGKPLPVAVRRATPAEIAADPQAAALLQQTRPERTLAVVPTAPLPVATRVAVTLPAGAPSAEGPLPTTGDQGLAFQTYDVLALSRTECGGSAARCRPGWSWSLVFTNPLDTDVDLDALVTVSPPLPGARFSIAGQVLVVSGRSQADTTYTVTVAPGLADVFGQTTAVPVQTKVRVDAGDPPWPRVSLPGPNPRIPDPFADPVLPVLAGGVPKVMVEVRRVTPSDWRAASEARDRLWERTPLTMPGEVLARLALPADPDAVQVVDLDLRPYLRDGRGSLLVLVETPPSVPERQRSRDLIWVDVTQLGLVAMVDAEEALIVASDLRTGRGLEGVEITQGGRAFGTTDAHGWLRAERIASGRDAPPLVARSGDDQAVLSAGGFGRWQGWSPGSAGETTVWYVTDDRHLYRPGETVHVKGWVRRVGFGKGGDVRPPNGKGRLGGSVTWRVRDAQGVELGAGEVALDAWQGFALDVPLPTTPNLGQASLQLEGADGSTWHGFAIEEFRRPTFEVAAEVETPGPHVLGQEVLLATTASYFAGGPLPAAEATWTLTSTPVPWSPPGHDDFRFGRWEPSWWHRWWAPQTPGAVSAHEGVTDALGTHRLRVGLEQLAPARTTSVRASARVMDVDRQAQAAEATFLVHPATAYVGVRPTQAFFEADEPVEVDLVAVDLDGEPLPGVALEVELRRMEMRWTRGTWREEVAASLPCAVSAGATPVRCSFRPDAGGRHELVARLTDTEGRPNETRQPIWVQGGAPDPVEQEGIPQERLTLVPDAETYAPGDVARVLVQSPFVPAEGVVTWRRGGLVHEERLVLTEPGAVVEVPIEDGHTPGLALQVDLFGQSARTRRDGTEVEGAPPRPAYATGRLELRVPPLHRKLTVDVQPAAKATAPGSSTTVTVAVTDVDGSPVADAQVALVMVDEAVLALAGGEIPDPLEVFHPDRSDQVADHHGRAAVALVDADALLGGEAEALPMEEEASGGAVRRSLRSLGQADGAEMAPQAMPAGASLRLEKSAVAGVMGGAAPPPPIAVRTDFRADALWAPAVVTGSDGRVTVPVVLPDSLTRYRITAVVVDQGRRFGKGEADLTARLPLMLRPSPPRFLSFGDRAELPLVVQNQTDAPLTFELALRGDNIVVDGADRGGRRASVPAHDRVEVRLPVATDRVGRAVFQAAVASGSHSDAARFDLPVWTPATREAFAVYGSLDGPSGTVALRQPLEVPDDVFPQLGGLRISTSSTALQALTDAVIHLVEYPYGCNEQIASRMIALVALQPVLEAFDVEGLPDRAALEAQVAADVQALVRRMQAGATWGWWRALGERPSVFVTLHVAHALVRADLAGFAVDPTLRVRVLQRLANLEPLLADVHDEPTRRALRAYALMVRRLGGKDTGAESLALYRKAGSVDALGLEATGWILPALAEADPGLLPTVLRGLANRATETAATAQWVTGYGEVEDALILHGSRRTDAVLLDALLQVQPELDLLPKVVAGLLGARTAGHWGSTQEDGWVLLALQRYFHTAEGVTPDLVARAWLGDAAAAEHAFRGRTTETATTDVPMAWLAERGPTDLVLAREGAGRLYYRLGLSYVPRDLVLEPAERGFSVERTYEGVDDPGDVRREADGTWRVRAGARVRVTLRMVAPARRYHVALVDPMPAGFEVLDPGLATTEDLPPAPPDADDPWSRPWWWGTWYDHENLRDERVEAFARTVWPGVHTYTYVVRATTPGSFVASPTTAEEMYHPETFGRSGTMRVIVED
ncbi:MAG: hypothetical protein H6732_19415 [Alphaproteobacteria bacterium]|nr:hypothetical protein [Alphaproteobacteria bacterium]